MSFLLGLLTAVLFFDCLFLILLILVQLPKKEAGMGTAFGGAATDALFGAGTGNALTKMTKYATAIFFCLALLLSVMNANRSYQNKTRLQDVLKQQAATSANQGQPPTLSSNLLESMAKTTGTNLVANTNLQAASPTNAGTAKLATNTPAAKPVTTTPTAKPATNTPAGPAK
jgi:protein translocase SecG subunit